MGINKTQQSEQMATFDVTGTADCPSMNFVVAGVADATALAALAAEIQAWSDGYNMTMTETFDSTYFASMASDATLEVAFGNAATLATSPNGAYNYAFGWSWENTSADTADVTSVNGLQSRYLTTAAVTADGDLGSDNSAAVGIYYDDGTAELKYGWTQTPSGVDDSSTDDFIVDNTFAGMFYMPSEPDTAVDGETDATGDRLDSGDVLGVFCGTAAPDAEGPTTLTVTLGAASLALAGSAALATA